MPVGDFEKSDTNDAESQLDPCLPEWEGTGFCNGSYLYMCVGGKDWLLDCTIFNDGPYVYTGEDANKGTIGCQ